MSRLDGRLGDYVTVALATEALGFPRDQTGRVYTLVAKGLPTQKIGGMTLVKLADLAEFSNGPLNEKARFPSAIENLDMEHLHSRQDAASILGVSARTVNRYANDGVVDSVDLSPWGGYTLYQLGTVTPHPVWVKIGDWQISAEIREDGRLVVNLAKPGARELFLSDPVNMYSQTAFFHESDYAPPTVQVRLVEELE